MKFELGFGVTVRVLFVPSDDDEVYVEGLCLL